MSSLPLYPAPYLDTISELQHEPGVLYFTSTLQVVGTAALIWPWWVRFGMREEVINPRISERNYSLSSLIYEMS